MTEPIKGIEATLNDLIKARPAKNITGFTPTGKVNTHQWGAYQSAFKGRGMEFAESRMYQAGDDVRNIDWKITARTGKTHTKLFQEERERPINLLVDMRAMMQFGTRARFKANLVAELTAQLAWVGHDGGDRVGGQILTRDGMKDFRGARTRRAVLRFLGAVAEQTHFHRKTTPAQSKEATLSEGIHRLRKTARPGSLVFILSDFYDFDAHTAQEIVRLSAHSHVTLIQVNDPLDKHLPATAGQLSDGVATLALSALNSKQLQTYSQAYEARQALLYKTCAKHGIVLHQLETADDPTRILRPKKGKQANKPMKTSQQEVTI